MSLPTLTRQGSLWADPQAQVRLLEGPWPIPHFTEQLARAGAPPLQANSLEVLQINLGKVCNQTCRHCHVDAGPDRTEQMSAETLACCLQILDQGQIPVLDITGGAPEMHPQFRELVASARALGKRIIDRCNLTILQSPGYTALPEFLAQQQVDIVASLPCYLEENVDKQRGNRVFERSLAALQRLNSLGYGLPGTGLALHLVFNPGGPSLPPSQPKLEADYRRELRARYGIEFTSLYTITNMPISRFLDDLWQSGRFETYLSKLVQAFNPATLAGVMCRTTLSVDWQGKLYDCDFNQMLDMELEPGVPRHVREVDAAGLLALQRRSIVTGRHCFGCTAGAGSTCQGAVV